MLRFISVFNLFILTFIVSNAYSQDIEWNGKVYNDQTVSELITVITTTNPIPSIPKTNHIFKSQKSLFKIPALAKCKKIIVFDGIQPKFMDRKDNYDQYKKRIEKLTKSSKYFYNTKLIYCSSWVHLAGAIKEALKKVKTPFVFIHQHDFILIKKFDLNALIATMVANPLIQHVRPMLAPTNIDPVFGACWEGPVDAQVDGIHFVPLCRTFGWSDNDHVARADYYQNIVFPNCGHGPMEAFLHPMLRNAIDVLGVDAGHRQFGTYLYGGLTDGGYYRHSDGRKSKK